MRRHKIFLAVVGVLFGLWLRLLILGQAQQVGLGLDRLNRWRGLNILDLADPSCAPRCAAVGVVDIADQNALAHRPHF